ncbi:hypothetical protein [Mycolicibacterium goodii]|uniref:Lipoprotein n=1 Tax=Mycolicibacterium goodii TaxID=134601 RepID=A0ABS6HMV8_MYCGD|nr:hypothetical protein [Mycolicibacterium goodii]MBU8812312.1 hypothetical protein [Mycolicibacterium goodii]MBU8818780.1 hypothetical protein [Mycolicibacterium goodii]MBU8824023.1 hypothetical protein [Mycolicibacterium goodii]MBU8832552.1 hypothetical protein [Mycolicibacterium goodii]MBU8836668.1 hypothetical protein [Mycolicibacterium goodii]
MSWQFGATHRVAGVALGGSAVIAMVVVGCSTVTGGTAQVDPAEAPVYRASVSASIEASSLTSAARESERQATLTQRAIHTVCEDLSTSSVDAIDAVNAYIEAANNNSPDMAAKAGPAVDALNRSADLVTAGVNDTLPADLRGALTEWVDAVRAVSSAISGNASPDVFNAASDRSNAARTAALDRCDAAY